MSFSEKSGLQENLLLAFLDYSSLNQSEWMKKAATSAVAIEINIDEFGHDVDTNRD